MLLPTVIRSIVARVPTVRPHLSTRARWVAAAPTDYKTYDFYLDTLERLIQSVYDNHIGGEFIDIMASLVQGQLTQAYRQAWIDEEGEGDLPDYLTGELESMILAQYEHVDQLYRDVVDARVDNEPIGPLLTRAQQWANQWDVAYRDALHLIHTANGGNLIWRKGQTEHGCSTCDALNGIIAPASVWEELGVHPRGYPNPLLECGGGGPANYCDCDLEPTDRRRSPKAFDSILNIISR